MLLSIFCELLGLLPEYTFHDDLVHEDRSTRSPDFIMHFHCFVRTASGSQVRPILLPSMILAERFQEGSNRQAEQNDYRYASSIGAQLRPTAYEWTNVLSATSCWTLPDERKPPSDSCAFSSSSSLTK